MAEVVWVYRSDGRRFSEGCQNGISPRDFCRSFYQRSTLIFVQITKSLFAILLRFS